MKYLIKNRKTGEETLCEKVEVCGFDYYLSNDTITINSFIISNDSVSAVWVDGKIIFPAMLDLKQWRKVIATNNKSLNLPQVIDEVEIITEALCTKKGLENNTIDLNAYAGGIIDGYQKAKETYQFTKEDLINFKQQAPLILEQLNGASDDYLFNIWQEQRTKTIVVE